MFKIGDKVRVRKDLVVGKAYDDGVAFVSDMKKFLGKEVVISEVTGGKSVHIIGSNWNWTDEMLEQIEETIKAYDLMKLAAENPEKYEGKKYQVIKGAAIDAAFAKEYETVIVKDSVLTDTDNCYRIYVSDMTELKEVVKLEPIGVDFITAVRSNKPITSEDNKVKRCTPEFVISQLFMPDMAHRVKGKWFIND